MRFIFFTDKGNTPESGQKNGAGKGDRTLDNHVGNVALYR